MRTLLLILFYSLQAHADLQAPWPKDVKSRLEAYLKSPPAKTKRIAAFDWDNTVMKNDIGDATLFWMVANEKIKNPLKMGLSWSEFAPHLTEHAIAALEKECGKDKNVLPSKSKPLCADAILNIYEDALPEGKPAFQKNKNPDLNRLDYLFYAQLFHGYTPSEVKRFTEAALKENLARPIGAKQKIGTKEYTGYVRIYDQMKELLSQLKKKGFDVWIISASIQPTVEVVAKQVGIPSSHVIGVRQQIDKRNGTLTNKFLGCGSYSDGNTELISYRLGKRCWLNKIVFGIKDANEQMSSPSQISFAAGDSDGDVFFLKDAKDLRIVLNRGKKELMCNAYANLDGKWLIAPMFIEPATKNPKSYSCKDFGLSDQQDIAL